MLDKALKEKTKTDTTLIPKQGKLLHESEYKGGKKVEDVLPLPEKYIYISIPSREEGESRPSFLLLLSRVGDWIDTLYNLNKGQGP